jgi:hypothetical protein
MQKTVGVYRQTFPLRQLEAGTGNSGDATGIKINSGFNLPEQTEVVRAGSLILPLLFYNHFQARYQVVLGQDVLDEEWSQFVDSRLKTFASDLADIGINNVQLELKKAMAHGKYISGHAYIPTPYSYYNAVQSVNLSRSKDATAEVAMSLMWIDNEGKEQSREASVKLNISKKGVYSGQVRTLIGQTINLSPYDINFHFNHDISTNPPYLPNEPMMTVHVYRLCDLLVLGLDELCETILMEGRGEEVKVLPPSYESTLLQARNLLWERLRGNKTGKRFSRGYSNSGGFRSGSFYDFVSNRGQLTVDVGTERQGFSVEQYLFSHGQRTSQFRHLYFSPEEVLKNTNAVIDKIKEEVK